MIPETDRERIAQQLGLPSEQVTDTLIAKIAEDPLFLQHLDACKGDVEMLEILLGETKSTSRAPAAKHDTVELIARAGAALTRWAASSFARVGDAEYNRRLSICQSCEHLSSPPTNSAIYRLATAVANTKSVCGLCGCDTRKKARLATERCPDVGFGEEGRWGPTQ
jgi:hypothetical protein